MDETMFKILNEFGEEIECEVLFTYTDEKTDKNYIAYTDNSLDDEGNTRVYVSIFDPDTDPTVLHPVETDEEWEMLEGIMASLQGEDSEDGLPEIESALSKMFPDSSEEEIAELKKMLTAPLDDDDEE